MCVPSEQKERIELIAFGSFAAASVAGLCSFQALYFLSEDARLQPLSWAGLTVILGLWTKSPASIIPRIDGLCTGPASHKQRIDRITFLALSLLSLITFGGGLTTYLLDDNPAKRTVALSSAMGIVALWASPPGKIVPKLADLLLRRAPAEEAAEQAAEQPAVQLQPAGVGTLRIV